MFQKLHRRLTLICSAGTIAVLLAVTWAALHFSLTRLELQQQEEFGGNLNTIFYYLRAQPVVDQAWLSNTESNSGLFIDIRLDGYALRYTAQSPQKEFLLQNAANLAQQAHGYNPALRPDGVTPFVVRFPFEAEATSYRAAVASVPYGDNWLQVTILKDRAGELQLRRQLFVTFGCIAAFATLALTLFAYYFTGRAIQPVKESHKRQRDFVSSASHELRTPLSVMRIGIGLLKTAPQNSARLADKLDTECARLSGLIDDLLLLARADDGRWTLQVSCPPPKTLLLNTYERFADTARTRNISLLLDVPEISSDKVNCDQSRIEQVLSILIDNALQYTPERGTIRLGFFQNSKQILFVVEDSGPGIPDEEKPCIFDRFYRIDQARSQVEHHGLGLSIAREIALLHAGALTAQDSTALGGAKFVLALPTTQ